MFYKKYFVVLLLIFAMLAAHEVEAKWQINVVVAEDFDVTDLEKIAIVTVECAEVVECSAIERKAYREAMTMRLGFRIATEKQVREALFSGGHTEYSTELRGFLVEELGLDGVLELKIPFAKRGEGYGGRRGSEAKVEMVLVNPEGAILLHGVGVGRPKLVVTSPERVAGNVVERLLEKAFK